MNKIIFALVVSLIFGCKGGDGSATNSTTELSGSIAGVAANGAPIPFGTVAIKDAKGNTKTTTTARDGSYSVSVTGLTPPLIVKVTSFDGLKYLTIADRDIIANSKKVNVTPLTHTIISNVLSEVNADNIYSSFENSIDSGLSTKLTIEKSSLKQKLIDSGLVGGAGVASDGIDILNGQFTAGTSVGLDAVLDAINVDASNASTGIQISLKSGGSSIITDKVNGDVDGVVNTIDSTSMTKTNEIIDALGKIRTNLTNIENVINNYASCTGIPVDDGSTCDIDSFHSDFVSNLHVDFLNTHGDNANQKAWEWICSGGATSVYSKADCLNLGEIQRPILFKDVSIVSYDSVTQIAIAKVHVYDGNTLLAVRNKEFKKDGSLFKLNN